ADIDSLLLDPVLQLSLGVLGPGFRGGRAGKRPSCLLKISFYAFGKLFKLIRKHAVLQRIIPDSIQAFSVIDPADTLHLRFLKLKPVFAQITLIQIHPAVFMIFKKTAVKFLLMVSDMRKEKMKLFRIGLYAQLFLKLPDCRFQKILARRNVAR